LNDQLRIIEKDFYQRIEAMLVGAVAQSGPGKLKAGTIITDEYLAGLKPSQWLEIRLKEEEQNLHWKPSSSR
jgi:DNA-directed RNA polymerase subunit beta